MKTIVNFFIALGFDFKNDLKPKKSPLENNHNLNSKLKNSFFFYNNPNQTNTSFYLITKKLNKHEFSIIRNYVWNESVASLIFYRSETATKTNNNDLTLFYAKASPIIDYNKCIVDTFNISEKKTDTFIATETDIAKIEKIKKWTFDSGTLWINYHSFLKKAKYKGIDKELVDTLHALKVKLNTLVSIVEKDTDKKEEIVQALIDRTLYIKYLEDNHIINSYFYKHYFGDKDTSYKILLQSADKENLNILFSLIHTIFNNELFERPDIESKYLTQDVCDIIYNSLSANLKTRQLKLFDFQFDVIPVGFISYIYEIFLTEKQKENGIYYTPKKLAQLIVDDVIPERKIGKVLDPSCGSGMFLIVAFQKLLENSSDNKLKTVAEKIEYRTRLLSENIFGIEKEITAQRFTLFSLSLQLFRGLNLADIRELIEKQLKEDNQVTLFKKYSFFKNIHYANTLSQSNPPFDGDSFDYIVGNPPFFEIKDTEEYKDEIEFLNKKQIKFDNKTVKTKDIVGKHQISQCFFIKIKDWGHKNTRFGFVSNSSNFYNDNSKYFQKYFYTEYNIEKIYELSRVKKILFENAKESVISIIFSNDKIIQNKIEYYPVDLGIFSEKPFELLIIQQDKIVSIDQNNLTNNKIKARDFLIGNKDDRKLVKGIYLNSILLSEFIIDTKESIRGIQIWGEDAAKKEFEIPKNKWKKLSLIQKNEYKQVFLDKYIRNEQSDKYNISLYKPNNLSNFKLLEANQFVYNISNFDKIRKEKIFEGEKILWNRIGKLKAVYSSTKIYFNFDVYSIRLNDNSLYFLITAILNSKLVSYYIDNSLRKRVGSSFPKIGADDIKKIPIPKKLDFELVEEISNISRNLSLKKHKYTEQIEEKLNNLIFDLYDLGYWEKQRIKDSFTKAKKTSNSKKELSKYSKVFENSVNFYLSNPIKIEFSNTNSGLIVAKVSLNGESQTPSAQKTQRYILNEIFEENPNENFLASQEKIYGTDCVYIIKKDINLNWSETKAYEDGQELLKHLFPNE